MKTNNETKNIMIEPIMDEETMTAVVEDNINIVPKNQRKKFDSLSLQHKVAKIQFYQDMAKMKDDSRIKNSIPYRVKELFDKRHATIDDATEVIKFAQEFVDSFKQRQIEDIDRQIAELEEMKLKL